MPNFITGYFEKHGIQKRDIPTALLIFEAETWAFRFLALGVCFWRSPSRTFANSRIVQRWKSQSPRFRGFYERTSVTTQKYSTKLSKYRLVQSFSRVFRIQPQRFVYSCAEGLIAYEVTRPITMPIQMLILLQIYARRKPSITSMQSLVDLQESSYRMYEEMNDKIEESISDDDSR